jgi:hypothetical protein
MALLGQGVVAIWNDVAPEGLAEFYEWHHREHMPERVGIPGFLRGRRYITVRGAPEFFTLYEATGADVLAGPHYLERLNNPTPLTRHVIPKYFQNMVRGVCNVRFSVGVGEGGWLITLRFAAEAGREDALSRNAHDPRRAPLRRRRAGEHHRNLGTQVARRRCSRVAGDDRRRDSGWSRCRV